MDDTRDRIQIRVSEDGLEARVAVAPGEPGDPGLLRSALAELGIVAGLDEVAIEAVARVLATETGLQAERRVACGRAPVPGTPPRLELAEPPGPLPGTRRADGSLDFRERQLIRPVRRDEPIGQVQPAGKGEPGLDVYGEPIAPAPPPELVVPLGEGVAREEDGRLIARRDGARTIAADGTIDVVAHHVHAGPVDLRSGNLDTRGSLEIKRDVTANMRVHADFDLVIGGTLDGARVEAGGSIEIRGGAIGREAGSVRAAGDLRVRHALGIRLEAGGELRVARSVSTSQLVGREIEVAGVLLGDGATAERRIVANDVGSPAGGPCVLRVAWPLDPAPAADAAGAKEAANPDPVRGLPPVVPPETRPARAGSLRARKRGGRRTERGARALGARDAELARRIEWRQRQRALQEIATIEVRGVAHAGCRLDFGIAPLVLEQDERSRRWRLSPERDRIVCEDL